MDKVFNPRARESFYNCVIFIFLSNFYFFTVARVTSDGSGVKEASTDELNKSITKLLNAQIATLDNKASTILDQLITLTKTDLKDNQFTKERYWKSLIESVTNETDIFTDRNKWYYNVLAMQKLGDLITTSKMISNDDYTGKSVGFNLRTVHNSKSRLKYVKIFLEKITYTFSEESKKSRKKSKNQKIKKNQKTY